MTPAPKSPELIRHLRELFRADPVAHATAVRTGQSTAWKPTYPGEQPPF